jgi:predicted transposase YdaD
VKTDASIENSAIALDRQWRDIMQESTVYRSIRREAQDARDRAIALNLLRRGVAIDIIAPATGLLIEEVQQLQQQLNESSQN